MGRWAEIANSVMMQTLLACRADGKSLPDTAKSIDAAYPFGEREHHPYKVWLRERKVFFARHGIPRNGKRKSQQEQLDDLIAVMQSKRHWA